MLIRFVQFGALASVLAACGDAGGGLPTGPNAPAAAASTSNMLPPSGQGNSGGVLAGDGAPAAGVEATMRYNGSSRRSSGARVDFHNGDLTGVSVDCSRAGGGATVPECNTTNADSAWLVNELSGRYAYAGAYAINGHGPDEDKDSFVAIHSGPGQAVNQVVTLPDEELGYRGAFQAGGAVIHEGVQYEGRVNGTMNLTADFASATVSADFNGRLFEEEDAAYVNLDAGFEDAVIGPDGAFYNAEGTEFSFAGQEAWGELDGTFYGPNGEEVAGTYGFGNASGGMTGIMLGCSNNLSTYCVSNSPRF